MTWFLLAVGLMVPRYEIQAVTYDGNLYVAGSGGSCEDAWVVAVLPDDWRRVDCVMVAEWR